MKKLRILSIMLALIILSSAFAMTGNAAYSGGSEIADIANVEVLSDSAYDDGLKGISLLHLGEDNLASEDIIYHGSYTGGCISGTYMNSANQTINQYYYDVNNCSSADDSNIATFKFRNCGIIGNQQVDVYLHIDRVQHISGDTGMTGKIPLICTVVTPTSNSAMTIGSFHGASSATNQKTTITTEIRVHSDTGDGRILNGYRVYNVFSDLDGVDGNSEAALALAGHTNNFIVYESCQLTASKVDSDEDNDGIAESRVKWTTKGTACSTEKASYVTGGVYAETDGSGVFTTTYDVSRYGTFITVSQSASILSKKATLTYDANVEQGGYFSSDSTKATTSKQYGEYDVSTAAATETVTGATGEYAMSNDGYTFTGWNTKADGTGTAYAPNATITFSDDTVLYAQWEEEQDTYIVQFCYDPSANQGSQVIYTERNITSSTYILTSAPIPASENQHILVEDGLPVKEDKVFAGWYSTAAGSRSRDASTALPQTIDLSQMEKQTVDGEEVIRFYAGFVDEGTPAQDASDTNDYGKTTLDGYALEGVQIRKANVKDPYTNEYNKVYDGLRFLTVYSNAMLTELDRVSSSAVEYGYAVGIRSHFGQLRSFTHELEGAANVDCTREGDRNHHYYDDYRLSTLVIKYETADEQSNYKSEPVIARPYVEYTDANGFHRYAYDNYQGNSCSGRGCSVSLQQAIDGIEAYIQSK